MRFVIHHDPMGFNIPKNKSVNGCAEYILVGACTDPQELLAIEHRLRGDVAGLENSTQIINGQLSSMAQMRSRIDNMMR